MPADPHKSKMFANHSFADNTSECALMCYNAGCSLAGFVPETGEDKGVCLLSFGSPSCTGVSKVNYAKAVGNIQMQCIECTSSESGSIETTLPTVSEATTVGPSSVSLEVTTVSSANATSVSLVASPSGAVQG